MVRTPQISVLLPVHNGLAYIHEAVDSIAAQTFEDWELVIVDNASTDGTFEYLQQRAQTERRIVLLRNQTDLGIAGSLNRGLAVSKGDWIARIDADDRALPRRLERQLAFVAENPDVAATSCLTYYISAAGRRSGISTSDLTTREAFQRYMCSDEPIFLLHSGALIRRKVLAEVDGYRGEFVPAEDMDLWARLSEQGLLLVQPEYLMEYRLHASSTIALFFDEARLKYEWARACMLARRRGLAEPTWAEFESEWRSAPLWLRLNRRRRILSERLGRGGRQDLAAGRRLKGAAKLAGSIALRPAYSAPRLVRHLRPAVSGPLASVSGL